MIRVKVSTSERFADWVGERRKIAEGAVQAGVAAAGEGLKVALRQHVAAVLGPRIANTVMLRVYPDRKASFGAAAVVQARNAKADAILSAHEQGVTIRPKAGAALAIPTENVPLTRGAGRGGTRRMTPVEVEAAFNRELRFARLSTVSSRKAIGVLILDEVSDRIRATRRGVKGFRQSRAKRLAGARQSVVMFVLVRQVRLAKRIDAAALVAQWGERVPELIERALPSDV